MKWIKKIILVLLFLLLVSLLFLFSISINLKNVLVNGVIKETIKTQIIKKDYQEGNNTKEIITEENINAITDDERIKEILNSKEVEELIDKYLDITINSMVDEENLDEVNIEKDILDYLKNNKETISEIVGEEVTDEMIEEAIKENDSKELTHYYKETIKNTRNNLTTAEKTVLKGYKLLISKTFHILLLIAILIDLVLTAILQKSFYKWIKTLAKALITSSIMIIGSSVIVKLIVTSISGVETFHTKPLLTTGIVLLISGVIMIIVYKMIVKEEKKNELS